MDRRAFSTLLAGLCVPALARAGERVTSGARVLSPDVTRIAGGRGWTLANRRVGVLDSGGRRAIRFDEGKGEGYALLDGARFADGAIEFDARGQDVLQRSFVGIAFHASDSAADVVYFRPFNFRSSDPERRVHAVQYVSPPEWGWKGLRAKFPGRYESAVDPAPDPDGWFHARIVIASPRVNVFVNGASQPCLSVAKLNRRTSGRVGLWVGDDSGGDFANLRLSPA